MNNLIQCIESFSNSIDFWNSAKRDIPKRQKLSLNFPEGYSTGLATQCNTVSRGLHCFVKNQSPFSLKSLLTAFRSLRLLESSTQQAVFPNASLPCQPLQLLRGSSSAGRADRSCPEHPRVSPRQCPCSPSASGSKSGEQRDGNPGSTGKLVCYRNYLFNTE